MSMFKATEDSPRMFENDFLDLFSRVHWSLVPIIYVPVTGFCLYSGYTAGLSWWATLLVGFAGFFAWTFAEYGLHRTLFHWVPGASWGEGLHFVLHGVHHDFPKDRYRLVMPPAASLFLLFFVFGPLFVLTMGAVGWAFLGGFVAGYINYDLTHYYIHHAKPKSKRMKRLRAHHMNHHFNKTNRKYGVSAILWDRVFRTL